MNLIRLNKNDKTIKVVNRKSNIRLTHTKNNNIKLQHTGKTGPASTIPGPAGAGIPAGGLESQVLQKASDQDYDFTWLNPTYSDKTYTQNFFIADSVLVEHNLNKYPSVTVIDSANDEVQGEVKYDNINTLTVSFTAPFSGKVTCN